MKFSFTSCNLQANRVPRFSLPPTLRSSWETGTTKILGTNLSSVKLVSSLYPGNKTSLKMKKLPYQLSFSYDVALRFIS